MSEVGLELRAGWRSLARHPTFTAVVVSLLGLGLGGLFFLGALYDRVVLRSLPVDAPQELVLAQRTLVAPNGQERPIGRFSRDDFEALRAGVAGEIDLVAYSPHSASLRFQDSDVAGPVESEWVSGNYFDALGVRPRVGRLFAPADERRDEGELDGAAVVVLSHAAWKTRLGGDRAAIGTTIVVESTPATIVGVLPAEFRSLRVGAAPELFRSIAAAPRDAEILWLAGRLAPGITPERVETKLRAAVAALATSRPAARQFLFVDGQTHEARSRLDVVPGARGESGLRGAFARSLLLVAAMFGALFVVLCANLANLLAARASAERRQSAIRAALGATRTRLLARVAGESLALALAGSAAGLAAALLAGPALLALLPVPGLAGAFDLGLDLRLAAVSCALAVATALAVGALAAREAWSPSLIAALGGASARTTDERRGVRWRWTMVGAQVGLSVVLLCGMALLGRSLGRLLAIDTGLPLDEVVAFRLELGPETAAKDRDLLNELAAALAALPGVEAAAYSGEPLLEGSSWFAQASIEGYAPRAGEPMLVNVVPASPGFFETLGLPIAAGRALERRDLDGSRAVVVVNERFVETYFAGRDALGRRLSFDGARGSFDEPRADDRVIVGVVADRLIADLRETPQPRVYPVVEREAASATFYLRSSAPPAALLPGVAARVSDVTPAGALGELRSLAALRDELLVSERFLSRLSSALGALALAIAALGLYGVLAFATAQRGRELALRAALGAAPRQLVRHMLRDASLALGLGALVGVAVSVPATRLLAGFLYGGEAVDPVALALALALLAAAATAACWLPARRALKLDPATLLRTE